MFNYLKQTIVVWLIKKVQKYGPHKVRVLGKTYEISGDVFNPKYYFTSRFMAAHVNVSPDDSVLDMGTGSGIQAITAGQTAFRVVAVDVNPHAVRFALKNVRSNSMEAIVSVLEGDLFKPLDKSRKFSVILFTPPYLDGRPKTDFDHALYDDKKQLAERFFRDARDYITDDGYIQMIYSSLAGPEKVLEISDRYGWRHALVASEKTFTEIFLIYKFTLKSSGHTIVS